jgi:hypothetical protein
VIKRGILINDAVHTGDNLDLLLKAYDLGTPEPKLNAFDLAGIDGTTDFTEAYDGTVYYSNRHMSFTFFAAGSRYNVLNVCQTLKQYHGQHVTIVFDDEPQYYYEGRAAVRVTEMGGTYAYITFELDAFPYKRSKTPIAFEHTVTSNGEEVTFTNQSSMPVRLSFYVDGVINPAEENYRAKFLVGKKSIYIPKDDFEKTVESDFIVSRGETVSIKFNLRKALNDRNVSFSSATFSIIHTRGYL